MTYQTCCICGKKFYGWGNNPWPLKERGNCCNTCNYLVIEARLDKMLAESIKDKADSSCESREK